MRLVTEIVTRGSVSWRDGSGGGGDGRESGPAGVVTMDDAFVTEIKLLPAEDGFTRNGYPWDLSAVAALEAGLALNPRVTYLIGENGSGKSTLLEAIAVAAGMNPEGGSSNFAFSTRESHSELGQAMRLVRGVRRPRTDFFLRAESLFTAATYLENLPCNPLAPYGGASLHEQSHGEAFLAVMIERFGPDGFYLLDEPEAALSTQNCLTCLRRIHELVLEGSQFIIATHSPIVLAYPDATIYSCQDDGLEAVSYDDADPVRLTQSFLGAREHFLGQLFAD
jgi:predicted ATPase